MTVKVCSALSECPAIASTSGPARTGVDVAVVIASGMNNEGEAANSSLAFGFRRHHEVGNGTGTNAPSEPREQGHVVLPGGGFTVPDVLKIALDIEATKDEEAA